MAAIKDEMYLWTGLYEVHKSNQNTLLPSSQKTCPKSFKKLLEKEFNFLKVKRKPQNGIISL